MQENRGIAAGTVHEENEMDGDLNNKIFNVKNCKKTFYFPIGPEDLLRLRPDQLSDMIISMVRIKRKIETGKIETDGLLEELQSRITLADGVLEFKLREIDDVNKRKEIFEDRNDDTDSLPHNINDIPVDVLQEMLSEIREIKESK